MTATRANVACPVHDAIGCERLAAQILLDPQMRNAVRASLENILWQHASKHFRERDLAEKIAIFEVADCWRHGDAPAPSMERSVFLWQSLIAREWVGGVPPAELCPVSREFFEAQRSAPVSVVYNHGGISLRDALMIERPPMKFDATWPKRITANAKPDDRFLVRMPFFRGRRLLDDACISDVVLGATMMPAVRQLAAESHLRHGTIEWPWHLTAIWTTVATEDWATTALGAVPGPATRH